ncbi:MAG: GNAT family N-acetyltransferase [Bacteroidota bacterium]
MSITFRKAQNTDQHEIWQILQQGILRRKHDGSDQWQDGYPNLAVVQQDIEKGVGFVLTDSQNIIGYCAILINDEPAYDGIEGNWITTGSFVVFHRIVIADSFLGNGYARLIFKYIEDYALSKSVFSIKADTNFDNIVMLNLFQKLGYKYCGEVYFRGSPRKAYEKVLR